MGEPGPREGLGQESQDTREGLGAGTQPGSRERCWTEYMFGSRQEQDVEAWKCLVDAQTEPWVDSTARKRAGRGKGGEELEGEGKWAGAGVPQSKEKTPLPRRPLLSGRCDRLSQSLSRLTE